MPRKEIEIAIAMCLSIITLSCVITKIGPKEEICEYWQNIVNKEGLIIVSDKNHTWSNHEGLAWRINKPNPTQFVCMGSVDEGVEILDKCNDLVFAVYGRCLFTSTNGTTWKYLNEIPFNVIGITYAKGNYFVIGDTGRVVQSATLDEGELVVNREPSINYLLGCFSFRDEVYAWSRDQIYQYITNKKEWQIVSNLREQKAHIYRVISLGGKIFLSQQNSLKVSEDAQSWHDADVFHLNDIAYGNNTYVAVGYYSDTTSSYYAFTSVDGIKWKAQNTPNLKGRGIARLVFTGSTFVAVGAFKSILESNDGVNWTITYVERDKYERHNEVKGLFDPFFEHLFDGLMK